MNEANIEKKMCRKTVKSQKHTYIVSFTISHQELFVNTHTHTHIHTKVYPNVSGLAAWSENCKWYSSLPLGAVISLFGESV
jgi:hypothetical protein